MNKLVYSLLALMLSLPLPLQAQQRPDFSGWWLTQPRGLPPLLAMLQTPPPLQPALLPALQAAIGSLFSGNNATDYCRPNQFIGFVNGEGFGDALELLFTPGRMTLTSAAGLLRRVHMDGRVLPAMPDLSYTGTSVGHWEGDTLVIETTGLVPTLRFPVPLRGAPSIGAGAHVIERYRLLDADTLEIQSVLQAPELLIAPFELTSYYVREREHEVQAEVMCPDTDRLIDRSAGSTQFDLTPPAGLPPPGK